MYFISYSDLTLSKTEKEILGAYHLRENIRNSWWGHFSEIPTENWGVRFQVVSSFRFERNMLLTIYQFLGSFTVPDSRYTNSPLFGFKT